MILSGKKTIIGAIVMAVSVAITELGYPELGNAFEKFAMAIIAIGLGHKIDKSVSNKPPAGFSKLAPMVGMLVLSIVALVGCQYLDKMYVKPAKPVCDDPAAYVVEHTIYSSVICDVCRNKLGIEPEQLDGILLDTVAISVITEATDKISVLRLVEKIEHILAHSDVEFAGLIAFLNLEAEQSELIAAILSRRLKAFDLPDLIGEFDKDLIQKHLKHQKEQIGVFE